MVSGSHISSTSERLESCGANLNNGTIRNDTMADYQDMRLPPAQPLELTSDGYHFSMRLIKSLLLHFHIPTLTTANPHCVRLPSLSEVCLA